VLSVDRAASVLMPITHDFLAQVAARCAEREAAERRRELRDTGCVGFRC
jgi:hypothetical protein